MRSIKTKTKHLATARYYESETQIQNSKKKCLVSLTFRQMFFFFGGGGGGGYY